MRLVLLTPQLPYPPQQGTTIRNFNIVKGLASHHDVSLLSFGTPEELEAAEPLRSLCRRIEIAPYPKRAMLQRAAATFFSPLPDMALRLESPLMRDRAATLLREMFDVIQVEAIEMAPYLRGAPRHLPFVFDDHNAEYVLQRTAFQADARMPRRWHGALYSLIQWKKLARYERRVCRLARRVIAASGRDAAAIRALDARLPVTVIPNGVDTDYFCPAQGEAVDRPSELTMVFAGKMDFRPNVDAMDWFCTDILPRIHAQVPSAWLTIVGQEPAPRVRALARHAQVVVTGRVPDTRPFLLDAAIYVVPLRMGSGTRLKVLEAMAMGKAIVSTSLGVEGIECTPGNQVIVSETPEAFAEAVVQLARDPARRRELGRSARKLVEQKYDWHQIIPLFDQLYSDVLR